MQVLMENIPNKCKIYIAFHPGMVYNAAIEEG